MRLRRLPTRNRAIDFRAPHELLDKPRTCLSSSDKIRDRTVIAYYVQERLNGFSAASGRNRIALIVSIYLWTFHPLAAFARRRL